jgi:Flp pilus assembly protein TadG
MKTTKTKTTKMKTTKMKTTKTSLRKIITGTIGSEIAEAALVLPIFFMIMLGIYWFGRAFNTYATINHAAREGARFAVAQTCSTCGTPNTGPTPDQIAVQVKQALQASSLDPAQVSHLTGVTRTACSGGPAVSCSVPVADPHICVYYNVQLQPTATLPANGGSPGCGVSVQFQYPYQFVLPYTSLNMQKIMLNAGVQMTGEY